MMKYLLNIIILIMAGCASISAQQQISELEESTQRYENAIRWGYFEIAESFRKRGDADKQPMDLIKLREFKVTSYEVLGRTMSKDKTQAEQTVEIKFYNINNMIEKTVVNNQLWEYDHAAKKWYILSNMPFIGDNY